LLAEIRQSAQNEIDGASLKDESGRYVISMFNYFGKWAEDKDAAITFRDRHILPAIEAGKKLTWIFVTLRQHPTVF